MGSVRTRSRWLWEAEHWFSGCRTFCIYGILWRCSACSAGNFRWPHPASSGCPFVDWLVESNLQTWGPVHSVASYHEKALLSVSTVLCLGEWCSHRRCAYILFNLVRSSLVSGAGSHRLTTFAVISWNNWLIMCSHSSEWLLISSTYAFGTGLVFDGCCRVMILKLAAATQLSSVSV